MANKAKRHIHKYHHVNLSYQKVWACALGDCNHYMPEYMTNMVLGKYSLCWNCGEQFVLDANNMKNVQPICSACSPEAELINDYLVNVIGE